MDRTTTTTHSDDSSKFGLDTPHREPSHGLRGSTRTVLAGSALAIALALTAADASAATIYVANTGTDGPSCGGQSAPCRTISQGVVVASAGDRVVVMPGVYGDVDGDGEFVTPGDEPVQYNEGCNCIVNVDKPVTILSDAGAGATILRGAVDGIFAVNINAPGVTLGRKKKGFSIVGDLQHDGFGVRVGDVATGAHVEGNAFSRLEKGLFVAGNGSVITGNRIGQVFSQGIHAEGEHIKITSNVVEQTGMPGGHDSAIHVVGTGKAGHTIDHNLVVGNFGIGIYVDNGNGASAGEPHVVSNNLVVGNGAAGIKVVVAENSGGATVTGNSIYNNDTEAGTNCGLMTLSPGPTIDATNNFWGAPGGPGADPKDDVCAVGTPPNVSSAALVEFAIVAPPMR
jgi:hypothetical protein